MLPEPQHGAEVPMNKRGRGVRLYCYIYFISLFFMRLFRMYLVLSCLGCLAVAARGPEGLPGGHLPRIRNA